METEAMENARVGATRIDIRDLLTTSIRKVQVTGGSSFMVTLPKDWATKVELKDKDHMLIQEQPDGSLVLRPIAPRVA